MCHVQAPALSSLCVRLPVHAYVRAYEFIHISLFFSFVKHTHTLMNFQQICACVLVLLLYWSMVCKNTKPAAEFLD